MKEREIEREGVRERREKRINRLGPGVVIVEVDVIVVLLLLLVGGGGGGGAVVIGIDIVRGREKERDHYSKD